LDDSFQVVVQKELDCVGSSGIAGLERRLLRRGDVSERSHGKHGQPCDMTLVQSIIGSSFA
jgi:hypothetical protein